MLAISEDAIICDLAETYHILNFEEYPPTLIAKLVKGLRPDARIWTEKSDMDIPYMDLINIAIFDRLNWLCWTKTKDAEKGHNPPESLLARYTEVKNRDYQIFESEDDFERKRQEILKKCQK